MERKDGLDLQAMKIKIENSRRQLGPCDKCGGSVPFGNDAFVLDLLMGTLPREPFHYPINSRHLEPVIDENNVVVCEGSPSRWQDISSLVDRNRRGYAHGEQWAEKARKAYSFMQILSKDISG